jgi:hypothetical protein
MRDPAQYPNTSRNVMMNINAARQGQESVIELPFVVSLSNHERKFVARINSKRGRGCTLQRL